MKKPVTSKSYFFSLTLISFAQPFVLTLFAGVVFFLISSGQFSPDEGLKSIFQYLVPIGFIVTLTMGHFVFKSLIGNVNPSSNLKEKMRKYMTAFLVRAALIEVGGFLGAIAAFLTGDLYYLVAALLAIVILVILRPGHHTIAEDLNLPSEEKKLLQNPEAIVSEM
jgi:hypothetical protein